MNANALFPCHRPGECSRVVVTGDVLRPFATAHGMESATWKNIRWLLHMLAAPLRAAGMTARALSWDERAPAAWCDHWDAPAFYATLGMAPTQDAWARLVTRADAPDVLIEALEPYVRDALVVGYELPPPMIHALQQLGRPFVDVVLHPVRFMPDLVFALRTNVAPWHACLRANALDEEAIELQAGHILAKAAWMAPPMALPPGTALLLGQVATDRAAANADGSFASLEQHLDALHELCCTHPLVVFRPHPYAGNDDPSLAAVARLPAIRTTHHNFYHLLAQPEVETVVALNSSGLVEARHFGREARNFRPFLYDFTPTSDPGSLVPMSSAWATPAFWKALLCDEPVGSLATLAAGTLRRSMNADWGYGFIARHCV